MIADSKSQRKVTCHNEAVEKECCWYDYHPSFFGLHYDSGLFLSRKESRQCQLSIGHNAPRLKASPANEVVRGYSAARVCRCQPFLKISRQVRALRKSLSSST